MNDELERIFDEALGLLEAQLWRGNIPELHNVLEQAAMRSESHRIEVQAIEAVVRESGLPPLTAAAVQPDLAVPPTVNPAPDAAGLLRPLAVQVAELEARAIQAALAAHKGNKVAAAKALGIARATLYGRL